MSDASPAWLIEAIELLRPCEDAGEKITRVSGVLFAAERGETRRLSESMKAIVDLKLPDGVWQPIFMSLARIFEARPAVPLSVARRPIAVRVHRIGRGPGTPRLHERDWLPLTGAIYRRDGRVCAYCQDTVGPFCIDHIHPLSRGGTNDPSNLTVACMACNSSKCDLLLSEWKGRYGYQR